MVFLLERLCGLGTVGAWAAGEGGSLCHERVALGQPVNAAG
jgi:hypothetical protein